MPASALPPEVQVFVRDWLSANNVLLKSADGHVLVDTGYVRHAPLTLALLASTRGLAGEPLARVVNTHCHADHIGGNAAVQRAYGCPISLPEGEVAIVAAWDTKKLLLDYADQSAERFAVDDVLYPGTVHVWGDLEWQALAAPGHDMGALVFYNEEHQILIAGDALWEDGYGIVMPAAIDPSALPAARATLDMIARLPIRTVIPGHGDVFTDVGAALERAFTRTTAFEANDARMARTALKALLTFCLLDRREMRVAELPAFVARVGIFRDLNDTCLQLSPNDLAAMLVRELERVGAVTCADGLLRPTRQT